MVTAMNETCNEDEVRHPQTIQTQEFYATNYVISIPTDVWSELKTGIVDVVRRFESLTQSWQRIFEELSNQLRSS